MADQPRGGLSSKTRPFSAFYVSRILLVDLYDREPFEEERVYANRIDPILVT